MMMNRPVAFNGKFLSGSPSGVHRVAESLILGVDRLLAADGGAAGWELLTPKDAARRLELEVIQRRTVGSLTWQPWEQFELPWHARRHLLINLCNLAPIASRGAITMIHDAQVFISPQSYSPAFRHWYQFALPRIGKAAARILTVSDYSRHQLAQYGIAPIEKIEVVHNGVDHLGAAPRDDRVLETLSLPPKGYVIALANTQVHKNVGVLLKAFASPGLANLPLVLVGAHTAADFQAAGHAVPANVVFAGRVSDAEFAALYAGALCLAFPSTTEGFGLPPLEAMIAGCPTLVAPCGALPEVCGEASTYVDAHAPQAWVEAIAKLRDDAAERERLIAAGRVQAAKFSWDRSSRRLLDIIREVAVEPGSRV